MNPPNWPSVTQVLREMDLTSGSDFFKPKHLRRGRLTHAACHIIARGQTITPGWWDESSGDPNNPDDYVLHSQCRPHVEAFAKWMRDSDWELATDSMCELPVENRAALYHGHIDQIGYLNGERYLIDIKNGDPEPWHNLQTSAYKEAFAVQTAIIVKRGCLYLPAGKFVPHSDPRDFAYFRAAVTLWHWRNTHKCH